MPEKVVIIVEAKTDGAVKNIDKVDDALERVSKSADDAATETKGLGDEVRESGAAISLLDAATGGLASRVRDVVEVYKQFRGRIFNVTAAQLKANLAFLANPYVAVGAAVVGLTAAFARYASSLTDDVVPTTESLKNMFLSLGNAQRFARLQAESYTKFKTEEEIAATERAIAVLQAFGEETIDLEIQNAEKRLSFLKKGEEDYEATLTELLVLRAQKAKAAGEKEAEEYEKGRQEQLKRIQEQEQFEADQKALAALQDEFDRGFLEEESYQAGRKAVYGEPEETVVDDDAVLAGLSGYVDEADIDIENDPELIRQVELGKALIEAEEEKNEKIKQARQDLFLNLASIFGAESKLGKAMIVAKQIQAARELAIEASKTISFAKTASARSTIATAEGAAQTAKVGFPQNIPLLIAYAAQAAGIIMAIKQATSAAGIATATPTFVPASPGQSPEIVQTVPQVSPVGASGISQLRETIEGQQRQPIKAYVVSSDVTSGQALDRNIIEGATI